MNLGGEPVNDSFDPESDGVPQIIDVSYKTLTEHVTGHFKSALKVLLSSACFRGDALDIMLKRSCVILHDNYRFGLQINKNNLLHITYISEMEICKGIGKKIKFINN